MYRLLVLVLIAGCRFDPAGVDDAPVDDAGGPAPDAPPVADVCADLDVVACWRFESAETIVDSSAYGNHGAVSGARTASGVHGLALELDGNSTVAVPDSVSLDLVGPITIELWLWVEEMPSFDSRAGIVDDNGQWGLFLSPAMEIRCAMGSTVAIGLAIPLEHWTHVACVYDRATLQLYQDAVAGPSIAYTAALPTAPTDGVHIGEDSPGGSDQLIGALDELRVWRTARTAVEIAETRSERVFER